MSRGFNSVWRRSSGVDPLNRGIASSSIASTRITRRRTAHSWHLSARYADSPSTILQTLADKVLEVLHADSAGLSLLTKDETRFYWAAIAGAWGPTSAAAPHVLSARAATCSITILRCYSLIGSFVIRI